MKKLRSFDWFGKSDKMGFVHRSWLRNQGYPNDYFQGKLAFAIPGANSRLAMDTFVILQSSGSEATRDLH